MNGMKNEIVMNNLKQRIEQENLEVLFVTEALLSANKQRELKKIFSSYDIFFRARKTIEKNKRYKQRGGVLCIAKKGVAKLERECECDDLLWVEWRGIKVVCAYFVPPTSPFAKRNEKRMIELQQRVLESNGKVIMLTDANAWIGQEASVITKLEDGYERQTLTFTRTSEKQETNKQGEWFLSAMNSIDMIILNGVRIQAKHTYDHPGREARSVVDFVVVNESVYALVSDLSYTDCRESLETDHLLVSIEVQHKDTAVAQVIAVKKKGKKKKKPVMELLKTVTRKDAFWKCLQDECDNKLADYSTVAGRSLNEDYELFKAKLTDAVTTSLKHTKPLKTILSARLNSNPQLTQLRKRKQELFCLVKTEDETEKRKLLKEEVSKVSRKLKQCTRKAINQFKREQVKEIENLEQDDCRRMWKELKALSGWSRKEDTSNTVLDEKKQEVSGEGVFEVWKEAFRVLGVEDMKDERFDVEFGEKVVKQQEEIYENSFEATNFRAELDSPININETVEAIKRLKLGKAAGNDEIVAEILMKGGDQVAYSVYMLCQKVWREETLPTDWTRGIIFPIFKDGDQKDTTNYRGITLLSIVGKVYAQVINARLMSWCEQNKVLVEEQGGFRPHRGCPDQLFSLVELLQNRGKKGTFCCFIDVKKAFDRVFRAGLWQRVADEGVKGKMWRVLRSIYETVESCVRVDGCLTEWFPVETGVRQGCVLSPLLYALFINGLIKEINSKNKGIEIEEGGKIVSALLYADDIVLMTNDRYALQELLDVVANYARKWRFELNPKKSEVVVFGQKYPPRNVEWKLGESTIKQVTQYKYLGIELTRKLSWSPYLQRILAKARKNMTQALAMGISGGFMTIRLANIIWMSLVRSLLEYGCEIWGERSVIAFEKLQLEMGKRILRCGSRMSEEVVRGELGWERQKARSDEMRLRYWAKIIRMEDDRIVKTIYRASRDRLEREEESLTQGEEVILTKTWCYYTRKLLKKLNLEEEWITEQVKEDEEWNKLIRERIHEREQIKWRSKCLLKRKLRTYALLKKSLRTEPYLEVHHRGGLPELTKLRGGTNRLRIEQGRYRKEKVEERVCEFCDSRQVEDEKHFVLECTAYADLREEMWRGFEEITKTERTKFESDEQKLNALIGDKFQPEEDDNDKNSPTARVYKEIVKIMMKYTTQAMNRRRGLQQ